jgi:hypothetical protein
VAPEPPASEQDVVDDDVDAEADDIDTDVDDG